jgi:hypothetical protein
MENGFLNEAGVALTEALAVNLILRKIVIVLPEVAIDNESFPKDQSGLTAVANSLREHTALQDFFWAEFGSRLVAEQI